MTADDTLQPADWPEIINQIRARIPARLFIGWSGAAYRTAMQLELREAHAAARDALRTELILQQQFSPEFLKRGGLFEIATERALKTSTLTTPISAGPSPTPPTQRS